MEAMFRAIVNVCSEHTANHGAFDTTFGMNCLNEIRRAMGLSWIDSVEQMNAALYSTTVKVLNDPGRTSSSTKERP